MRRNRLVDGHEERRAGWQCLLREWLACCCAPTGNWPGGTEAVKATSRNVCLHGETRCHVLSAWREVKAVGGFRSVRVRSEVREVRSDAWQVKIEARAS